MSSAPMTADQVLDEVAFLATVEHALIVEYLTVSCALGHDLDPADGGATTPQGQAGASAATSLAQSQMFRLKNVNRALVTAGREAQMGRATAISEPAPGGGSPGGGPEIALSPTDPAVFGHLADRELAIATAVDQRYRRLAPDLPSLFAGDVLDALTSAIVDDGPTHADAVADLNDAVSGAAPADLLRATRREPAGTLDQHLLNIGDQTYAQVVAALTQQFTQTDDFVAGTFRSFAVAAMTTLDEIDRALVQRGLLPAFTLG
jgi:hypothetical protein